MDSSAAPALTFEQCQAMVYDDPVVAATLQKARALDFGLLRKKLAEETGWTEEGLDEAQELYCKFLALLGRYPDRPVCPTETIDTFWHAHMLDTRAYEKDCRHLFGEVRHHYPYFGMRGPDDAQALEKAFRESTELFIRHYGIDPTADDSGPRSCRPQRCP